jgi:Tol biopolymer transport system component
MDSGFDLADLPGRVVFQGGNCASEMDFSSALADAATEGDGIDNVDEALALIDEFGGIDTTLAICVMNPDGTGLVRVSEPGVMAESPGWMDDGETVMYRSNFQWFVVGADGSGRRPWSDPTMLPWRVSPDGKSYIYEIVHDANIYMIPVGQERGGPGERSIVESYDIFTSGVRWSPDSSAVLVYKGPEDCPELWKIDVLTLKQTQLTGPGSPSEDVPLCADPNYASWSPDGRSILLADYEGVGPDPRPFVMNVDGSDLRPLVTDDFFDDPEWMMTDAVWSPDGRYVLIDVISTPGLVAGKPRLHVIRLSDGRILSVPLDPTVSVFDMVWMPEAPSLQPLVDEDIDAV